MSIKHVHEYKLGSLHTYRLTPTYLHHANRIAWFAMLRFPLSPRSVTCLLTSPRLIPSTTKLARTMASKPEKDWSANQYLLFNTQRTRPVHDLITQIKPLVTTPNPRIYDLGCGPGNSTSALLSAFPDGKITGMDSSSDMLKKARAEPDLANVKFVQGDLESFEVDVASQPDLLFSNAVFHWLRSPTRIPTLLRLFQTLKPGGVLAIQMPDNYSEPSHAAMRDTAVLSNKPWSKFFESKNIGDLSNANRPDLDPIESPHTYYNELIQHAAHVDIWRTTYSHVLAGAPEIVEWVKGTGLQPFLNQIEDAEAKQAFLEEYEKKVREGYEGLRDGKVILGYPRLFVVAVRK
jgi:trans-aconitate 2-methyltransferase